jgi:hypothetical protein
MVTLRMGRRTVTRIARACGPWLALAIGCNGPDTETDTDADADTDTDTDADTDTDTDTDPPVEDCSDGIDNDLDGLVDCEDDACLDACLEDCTDQIDNDGDGYADCADDECAAEAVCPHEYVVEAELLLTWRVIHADYIQKYFGYPTAGVAYGYVYIDGVPTDSELSGFSCGGMIFAFPPAAPYYPMGGMVYEAGDCDGCDYRFNFSPNVADGSLNWFGSNDLCPVAYLPAANLGFVGGTGAISTDDGGTWRTQYTSSDYLWYSYAGGQAMSGYLYDSVQVQPRTWAGTWSVTP